MDIEELLEKRVSRSVQIKLVLISSIYWSIVAAGVMVLSLTLPKIAQTYGLQSTTASLIASSTFFGMLTGALLSGNIADIIGRKPLIGILVSIISIFSALSGLKINFSTLLLVRFITGFGLGGLLPVVNAYLTEFSPKVVRGRLLVILEGSWAIGSIIIGIVAITLGKTNYSVTYFVFLLGLLTLVFLKFIPESIKFLLKKGRIDEAKKNLILLGIDYDGVIEIKKESVLRVPILNLFREKYLAITLMVFYVWFVISFSYYAFFTWLPRVISSLIGTEITKSINYTFTMLVMQLPGYLLGAYIIETIGRKKSLFISLLGTSIMAFFFATSRTPNHILINGSLLTIFCMSAWGIIYAYTPELYPTEFRATANGSAGALARVAGILAPIFISSQFKNLTFAISTLGVILVIGGILVLVIGRETKGKSIG
ncbi:MFS transporter [Caldisericum exile]|uniref:Major facilitator superfamily protein n=1 Tax=Caldisericum exile (strain DSM 21853 / NBRC 104410 / AZM16c01) TaxID=511051 RepID=A0A7U6GD08_CALEA|nr:MFS transporter [Caldisericum exile]BAL80158.1 major facilitator superfamily protein [Caldisericum exile AZM16c01]